MALQTSAKKKGKVLGRPKERDDAQIVELHRQGLSCRAIATKLHTSPMTVSRAIKLIRVM